MHFAISIYLFFLQMSIKTRLILIIEIKKKVLNEASYSEDCWMQ